MQSPLSSHQIIADELKLCIMKTILTLYMFMIFFLIDRKENNMSHGSVDVMIHLFVLFVKKCIEQHDISEIWSTLLRIPCFKILACLQKQ